MTIKVTDREAVARMIDPTVWHEGEYPAERSRIAARQSQALDLADRILASHADPLRRALEEVVRVSKSGANTVTFMIELNRVGKLCAAALSNTQPSPAYSMEKNK